MSSPPARTCTTKVWRCRCAAALYILRCVPALIAPFGVLTALLHLLLGSLLTILGAGALVVSTYRSTVWCQCTPCVAEDRDVSRT
jgi:hypothetical protein